MRSLSAARRDSQTARRHAGKQQHRSPADFVQTVNVVDVMAGIVADALLGFADQFVAFAELGRPGRTNLGAGRRLARGHAIRTHGALAHLGSTLPHS